MRSKVSPSEVEARCVMCPAEGGGTVLYTYSYNDVLSVDG